MKRRQFLASTITAAFIAPMVACRADEKPTPTPDAAPKSAAPLAYMNDPPERDFRFLVDAPENLLVTATLAGPNEPGERLNIRGRLFQSDGKTPAAGVLIYAYQTDATGNYSRDGSEQRGSYMWWHGHLRGYARTDAKGTYEIESIRPAPYPDRTEPAHIHCIAQTKDTKHAAYIPDFVFIGDPLFTDAYWRREDFKSDPSYRGLALERGPDGVWRGQRNITLSKEFDRPNDAPKLVKPGFND